MKKHPYSLGNLSSNRRILLFKVSDFDYLFNICFKNFFDSTLKNLLLIIYWRLLSFLFENQIFRTDLFTRDPYLINVFHQNCLWNNDESNFQSIDWGGAIFIQFLSKHPRKSTFSSKFCVGQTTYGAYLHFSYDKNLVTQFTLKRRLGISFGVVIYTIPPKLDNREAD